MTAINWLRKGAFLALAFAGSAQALQITLPPTSEPEAINIPGPYSVAWVHSFIGVGIGLPENGGGNLCSGLAADECSVNGSAAILKRNFDDGIAGTTEAGPLFNAAQIFTIDFAAPYDPALPLGLPDDPFRGGVSDGYWRYSSAPAFVTAWATKGGSAGYTVFYLVPDANPTQGYTGIGADIGTWLPFGTFDLDNDGNISAAGLSNIIFFDSDDGFPPQQTPEPGTLLLLGAALAGLEALRRRRR